MEATVTITLKEYEKLKGVLRRADENDGYFYNGWELRFFKNKEQYDAINKSILDRQAERIKTLELICIKAQRKWYNIF